MKKTIISTILIIFITIAVYSAMDYYEQNKTEVTKMFKAGDIVYEDNIGRSGTVTKFDDRTGIKFPITVTFDDGMTRLYSPNGKTVFYNATAAEVGGLHKFEVKPEETVGQP